MSDNFDLSLNGTMNDTSDECMWIYIFSPRRFTIETCLAVLAPLCNIAVPIAVGCSVSYRQRRTSVYNILFFNLSVVNVLSSFVAWASNSLPFLPAPDSPSDINFCRAMVKIFPGAFVSNALALVGALTMVGFSVIQLVAIRQPLRRSATLRRKRVAIFIAVAWTVSLLGALAALSVLVVIVDYWPCDMSMLMIIEVFQRYGVITNAAIQIFLYACNAAVCFKIYQQIQIVRCEMSRFRFEHSLRNERRAFVTIVTLLVTLNLFFVPFMILHVISLNFYKQLLCDRTVLYYMTIVPYLKYTSDPIIYGLRMRELDLCCRRSRTVCCRGLSDKRTLFETKSNRSVTSSSAVGMTSFYSSASEKQRRSQRSERQISL